MEKAKWPKTANGIIKIMLICTIMWSPLCQAAYWSDDSTTEYQKMVSTIEYAGEGQFKHQVETMLQIDKESLSDEQTKYYVSSQDFSFSQASNWQDSTNDYISFIVDNKTGRLTGGNRNLTTLEKVHNLCVDSLQEATKNNVGKTWKQSFDLSSFDYSMPKKLSLTMSAINVNTDEYGPMIAVRALSEPFVVSMLDSEGKVKDIKSRIRSAYLFDKNIEEIYLSISVFDASADIASKNEKLHHEVATYKTNAQGQAVDLKGLGKDFENFVRKVGLTNSDLKIEKEAALPQWAQSEGLRAAQISNICASTACEGAINPVSSICLPSAQTLQLQSMNRIASSRQITTVSSVLAKSVPALGGMKIAMAPAWAGYGIMTATHATALAGATAGGLAIAENNSNGSGRSRSPIYP